MVVYIYIIWYIVTIPYRTFWRRVAKGCYTNWIEVGAFFPLWQQWCYHSTATLCGARSNAYRCPCCWSHYITTMILPSPAQIGHKQPIYQTPFIPSAPLSQRRRGAAVHNQFDMQRGGCKLSKSWFLCIRCSKLDEDWCIVTQTWHCRVLVFSRFRYLAGIYVTARL